MYLQENLNRADQCIAVIHSALLEHRAKIALKKIVPKEMIKLMIRLPSLLSYYRSRCNSNLTLKREKTNISLTCSTLLHILRYQMTVTALKLKVLNLSIRYRIENAI